LPATSLEVPEPSMPVTAASVGAGIPRYDPIPGPASTINATPSQSFFDQLDHLEKDFPTGLDRSTDVPSTDSDVLSPLQRRDLENPLLFLAECARKGWNSDFCPTGPLLIPSSSNALDGREARLFDLWNSGHIHTIIQDQRAFFQHGLYGSKRDVALNLDPVQRGVVGEHRVADLFDR
jgi:hypothetical protein